MSAAPGSYVWWLAGRSAGVVAMLLLTVSVLLGLGLSSRLVPQRRRRSAMRAHQQLTLLSLAALAAHGLFLAADPWLKAGLRGVAVPFAIQYRPLWTGIGILGGYLAAALGLSFYARRWIGPRRWRRMHRLTVVAYVLALAHTLGAGTDASIPVVRDAVLLSAVPVVALFVARAVRGRSRAGRPERRQARAPTQRALEPQSSQIG